MQASRLIVAYLLLGMAGCRSTGLFESPNSVFKKEATVIMLDGRQKKGLLTVTLEVQFKEYFIRLFCDGKNEKIPVESIKCYRIANDVFVPKMIAVEYGKPLDFLFVKQVTPDSSRIQLYELFQSNIRRDSRDELLLYFISLPSFGRFEVWGMGNENLLPYFHEKMSQVVADCPVLSDKIKNKSNGYYFPEGVLLDIDRKLILETIINEYNACQRNTKDF